MVIFYTLGTYDCPFKHRSQTLVEFITDGLNMSEKAISKFNSIKSIRSAAWLAFAVLSFVSFSNTGRAQPWLDENFSNYILNAQLATTTSPNLINAGSFTRYTTVINDGGNVARYFKNTTANGSQVMFGFSPNTGTLAPRTSGFVSFKIKQNVNAAVGTALNLDVGIGNATAATTTSSSANRLIGLAFTQTGTSAGIVTVTKADGTANSTANSNVAYAGSTSFSTVRIWFNDSDTTTMPYTDPSGASQTLAVNSFVVYIGNTLITSSASGTALAAAATGASLNFGKIGFSTASGTAIDFSIDDIYAADSAPAVSSIAITSPDTASAMVGYPFTFQVVADATTFGSSSLPIGGLSITTGGLITGTPTTAGPLNVALSVSNAAGVTGSGNLLITVAAAPASAPVITSSPSASGNVGVDFRYQIAASNTPRSYAAANLPAGLNLNTTTGLISGFPTRVGDSTVTLTAENPAGTSFSQDLTISIGIAPPNIFTGSNPSLNTSSSWSLSSTPTSSANPGSYTDLIFSSTATNLSTTSGQILGKSWNVTNGNNYTFASASSAQTSFRLGTTGPDDTYPYYNTVAQEDNVMLFLTNGSKLTFLPANSVSGFASTTQVRNSGTLLIAAGSVADFQTTISAIAASNVLTKAGAGTLIFSASNSVAGGLIVSAGTVNATAPNSLGAGTLTVNGGAVNASADNAWTGSKALAINGGTATFSGSNNFTGVTTLIGGTLRLSNSAALGATNTSGTFVLSGGSVEALADYDLGHTYGTATNNGTNSWDKLDGNTTMVNGPVTLNATSGATLSLYRLAGNTNSSSVVTKTGNGTLKLMGGTPSGGWIGNWQINAGTLFVNTTSSGALGSNNAVVMNGGNLLFRKGVGSSGTYSGHGQDTALSVLAEATITLDPNPLTPAAANTVSFTNLNIGTQILHIAKGNSTKSSATDVGYTDPQLSFRSASLTGQATLDVAANVETVMQAGSGSGGVTKIGAGLLTLSDGTRVTTTVVDSLTNSVTNTIVSSYTGRTDIDAGTLALRGSHFSAITIGSSAALQLALVSSSSPTTTTTQGLTLTGGSKVRLVGTPTEASYTLVTASGGITGTPVLETPIDGYELVKSSDNKSLILQQTLQDGFSQYLVAQNLLPGTAFDAVVNGSKVGLQYAFGSPTGVPQNNGAAAVPVMNGNQLTYTFDVKDDSALTLTYQTSSDLVTWSAAQPVSAGTGSSPSGFLKKQAQSTGSGKLFIRINVTR